ncbi:hypothetical protein MSHOH_2160 [Methanosarcina horonobensis HB-1 = JCM 15518]|uniref:Uncharacterized protein n=1 Tax=Methanosarcina horonobensis HB-1 = JCM 15518 TaxID=1434110 RepID=A0A0E3SGF5_9EURY|nr:hypothetical protein [Methanosarcina horonobensis]AKB78643.1 hypothetical protein MSHOH_2160 [Methanosarcina horonobensis HB-1 = JCM 15518]
MAAWNWIVIIFTVLGFGLLYAATYDVVKDMHEHAYTGDAKAQTGANIVWLCWKYSPVAVLFACMIYGFTVAQKPTYR